MEPTQLYRTVGSFLIPLISSFFLEVMIGKITMQKENNRIKYTVLGNNAFSPPIFMCFRMASGA